MLWFLRDYPLAALLLRAATLAFSALLIGGVFFCAVVLPHGILKFESPRHIRHPRAESLADGRCRLAATQVCFVLLDSAMLLTTGGMHIADLYTANYFLAGALLIASAACFLLLTRFGLPARPAWLLFIVPLLFAMVWTSHSASRLEHRATLMVLTGLHQLAAALWIGGMPFLWLLLGSQSDAAAGNISADAAMQRAVRRYSATAVTSVIVLVLAGVSLGWFYTQSWSAVYGTAYGVVLVAKSALTGGVAPARSSQFPAHS